MAKEFFIPVWARNHWVWLVAALTVCSFFLYLMTPFSGDDYAYRAVFSGAEPRYGYLYYPRFPVSHWLHVNGRLFDKVMPLVTNMPRGLMAAACALMLGAMYVMAVRASRALSGWMPFVLVAAMALALPWWDSAFVFAVQLNYVWSTAMVLGAYIVMVRSAEKPFGHRGYIAGLIFCFLAGMCHEGASVPLIGGWAVYLFFSGRRPRGVQLRLLAAFVVGALVVLASPAFWTRVGGGGEANDSVALLLLKSEPLVLVMWAVVLAGLMFAPSRRRLLSFAATPAAVLAYATIFGAPVIVASGIVGRSGWFVSVFALVAVAAYFGPRAARRIPVLEWALSLVLVCQSVGLVVVQRGLWEEYKTYERDFIAAPDGVIRGDYTADDALPAWTFNRLRGVPDADDVYILECLSDYHRCDSVAPVLLRPSTRFVGSLPPGARRLDAAWIEAYVGEADGVEWVFTPVDSGYAVDRRVLDPGDR